MHRGIVRTASALMAAALALGLVAAAAAQKKEKAAGKAAVGRLPAYWGQLGLSEDQKERIRAAALEAEEKKEPLEKELRSLREQVKAKAKALAELDASLDARLQAMLTPEQRRKLSELKEAAKKASAKRDEFPKKPSKKRKSD